MASSVVGGYGNGNGNGNGWFPGSSTMIGDDDDEESLFLPMPSSGSVGGGKPGHATMMPMPPSEYVPYGFGGAAHGTHVSQLHFDSMATDLSTQEEHTKWLRTIKLEGQAVGNKSSLSIKHEHGTPASASAAVSASAACAPPQRPAPLAPPAVAMTPNIRVGMRPIITPTTAFADLTAPMQHIRSTMNNNLHQFPPNVQPAPTFTPTATPASSPPFLGADIASSIRSMSTGQQPVPLQQPLAINTATHDLMDSLLMDPELIMSPLNHANLGINAIGGGGGAPQQCVGAQLRLGQVGAGQSIMVAANNGDGMDGVSGSLLFDGTEDADLALESSLGFGIPPTTSSTLLASAASSAFSSASSTPSSTYVLNFGGMGGGSESDVLEYNDDSGAAAVNNDDGFSDDDDDDDDNDDGSDGGNGDGDDGDGADEARGYTGGRSHGRDTATASAVLSTAAVAAAASASTTGTTTTAAAGAAVNKRKSKSSKKISEAADKIKSRAECLDARGLYHDWVLGLGIKDRNKMIKRMQLTLDEKTVLIKGVRKYKQLISKRKYVAKLKAKGVTKLDARRSSSASPASSETGSTASSSGGSSV